MAVYTYNRDTNNMWNTKLMIENASIMSKNFSGLEKENNGRVVNQLGDMNFCVFIDDQELVEDMVNDGWNVHITKPDRDGNVRNYLPVAVKYKFRPPKIYLENDETNTSALMTENQVMRELDNAYFSKVNMVINTKIRNDVPGNKIKAFLQSMHIWIEDDDPFKRRGGSPYDYGEGEDLPFED